jgi:hypothetical protein
MADKRYAELTPAERAEMDYDEKLDAIQLSREATLAAQAEERAKSNPMFDFKNRPEAPTIQPGERGEDYLYYYSWVGGVNTGEWTLYRALKNEENLAKYGGRGIGGPTQATATSTSGANALKVQPQPIKDKDGNVTGWGIPSADGTIVKSNAVPTKFKTPEQIAAYNNAKATAELLVETKGGVLSDWFDSETGMVLKPTKLTTTPVVGTGNKSLTSNTGVTLGAPNNTNTTTPGGMTGSEYNQRLGVYASMAERFNRYGLTALGNKIKDLAIKGASEATITLELQDTPEYQERFSANAARIKKGLTALTPSEYVNTEDAYRQVLRSYGLKQFDNDAYIQQFISNDMSPTEFSNRVVTAVQRVQNSDPAILKQLTQYYGVGKNDLVAYVLDPEQQFQEIERRVAAAEIGVAAGRQGLEAGQDVARQLAAQGVSKQEAEQGYATIASRLPAAEKLSDIYGGTMDAYRQSEAEQDVFNSLASAQRKREALRQREIGAFSGSSGVNKTSLTSETRGQF